MAGTSEIAERDYKEADRSMDAMEARGGPAYFSHVSASELESILETAKRIASAIRHME